MSDRIDLFDNVAEVLKRGVSPFSCIDQMSKQITPHVTIKTRIGSDSVEGEAYKGCFSKDPKDCCDSIAIKLIPLMKDETKYVGMGITKASMSQKVWSEIGIMKLCSYLVKNSVCPNLPVLYKDFVCHNCQFENERVNEKMQEEYKRSRVPCIIALNEYANEGDLKYFLRKERSTALWLTMYFQIFAGLYTLQKYFDITHHDLHWGNVLVRRVQKGGYWKYIIDDNTYYIPNLGYQFLIWDFGFAWSPGKIEDPSRSWWHKDARNHPRSKVDYMKISEAPIWQLKHYRDLTPNKTMQVKFWDRMIRYYLAKVPLSLIIPLMFKKNFTSKPPKRAIIEEYSLNKPLSNLPQEMRWLIRDSTLLRDSVNEPYIPIDVGEPTIAKALKEAVDGDEPASTILFLSDSASEEFAPRKAIRPMPPPPAPPSKMRFDFTPSDDESEEDVYHSVNIAPPNRRPPALPLPALPDLSRESTNSSRSFEWA